jgi:hypothetical protein
MLECCAAASKESFCSNLTQTTCTQICKSGEEPEAYILLARHAISSQVMKQQIPRFNLRLGPTKIILALLHMKHLLPWNWTVQYKPKDDHRPTSCRNPKPCPSTFSKLGSFALINLLSLNVYVGVL